MEFLFLKKKLIMNKSTLAIIIYVIGLLFGALILKIWSSESGPKAFIGIAWTAIFLITLFYTEKNDQN
jgi:hypothetical protein